MNFGSLYSRLRLTAAATQSEIKSAYYRLSKIYHPDKNTNCPKATNQFRNITEAYEILSDPKAKLEYDKSIICHIIYKCHFRILIHVSYFVVHFPKQHFRGISYRRRRFQEEPVSNFCEETDAKVQDRMKQYLEQIEKRRYK